MASWRKNATNGPGSCPAIPPNPRHQGVLRPHLKCRLTLHCVAILFFHLDYVGMPWTLVDVLEERCESLLLALSFTFDLPARQQRVSKSSGRKGRRGKTYTLLLLVLRTQPVRLYSAARFLV